MEWINIYIESQKYLRTKSLPYLCTINCVKHRGIPKFGALEYVGKGTKPIEGVKLWKFKNDWYWVDEVKNELSLMAGNKHNGKIIINGI